MITLATDGGVRVKFDSGEDLRWDLFDAESNEKIGYLEANEDGMVVGANIKPEYRRRGVATAVIRHLVKECGREFLFWPPDGNAYDDARHLSEEGACLANSLVREGLAKWISVGPCEEIVDF